MVKGISRQVIVVRSPDPEMFEQAIFILRDGRKGVSDDVLLREANRLIGENHRKGTAKHSLREALVWSLIGALSTGVIWVITAFL